MSNDPDNFRCSQAVLLAFSDQLGIDREMALRIATGFGAGISGLGETCGAITGAVMAISLKFGQTNSEDQKAKEITYYHVQECIDQFKERNGSIICKELIGFDLTAPDGRKRFREEKIKDTICPKFVEDAKEILHELFHSWDENSPL
jgi:C_GCAxxG_C_C family probable redox protein